VATQHDVRFEPHERPPHLLAAGLGAQMVVLIVTGIMVTPLVVARAAGLDPATSSWLVFTALIASGIATWLQIGRIGRIGGGYVLFVGSNVAFVSVSVSAIQEGGVPLLATLVCVASLATFLFTARMGALRRVLTPAVGGTVLMLMALSVAPVVWGMLKKVPPEFAGTGVPPLLLLSTLVPIVAISLFAGPLLQLWAPLIGVLAAVLKEAPDLDALPRTTPRAVRRLLSRCLRKDPRMRLPDVGSARLELQEVLPGPYGQIALSPDERNPAFEMSDGVRGQSDLWVMDVARGVPSRVTTLLFLRLTTTGKTVNTKGAWALPLGGGDPAEVVRAAASWIDEPQLSPDGRCLAYMSSEPGRYEVYADPPRGALM
jgi:hypothetical protein